MIKSWVEDKKSLFQKDYFILNGYGIQELMSPGIVDRPSGTGDFLFMYFFDAVAVKIDGKEAAIPAGTIMPWQPGSYQYYGTREHPFTHSWVHCNGRLVHDILDTCGVRRDKPVFGLSGTNFEHHLKAIHFERSQTTQPDRRIIASHVSNLIFEIQRAGAARAAEGFVPAELLNTRQHIETHFNEPLTLPGLARLANVSPQHFCKRFKSAFGVPPIEYLLRFRFAQARYLLLDRNMRIGEIARRVGIEDVQYFSKMFKKRNGKSPRQMREEMA